MQTGEPEGKVKGGGSGEDWGVISLTRLYLRPKSERAGQGERSRLEQRQNSSNAISTSINRNTPLQSMEHI